MPVASKAIPLTKHEIEHNNSIVIIEINTFRLLFKIV